MRRMFASDNSSPACPEVLEQISTVNRSHYYSYGHDPISEGADELLAEIFGCEPADIIVAYTPNGTAANLVGLSTFLRPWDGVLTSGESHITQDECGGLEGLRGLKLFHLPSSQGKIRAADLRGQDNSSQNIHRNRPAAVSITLPTELGTLYSLDELAEIGQAARSQGLLFHVDGARMCNAVASLLREEGYEFGSDLRSEIESAGKMLRRATKECGVGALSLGLTKNGGMFGDLLIVFPENLPDWAKAADARPWPRLRLEIQRSQKQALSLFSKQRFVAAQAIALFQDGTWFRNAHQANLLAQSLAAGLQAIADEGGSLELVYPVQANGVWLKMPADWVDDLRERFGFYVWDESGPVVRLMISWDSTQVEVDRFLEAVAEKAQIARSSIGSSSRF